MNKGEIYMYPYQNTFEINYPKLEVKSTYPIDIISVELIKSPMAVLNGGRFKLLAEERKAVIIIDFGKETVGDILFKASGKGNLHFSYGESIEELSCEKEKVNCSWYQYCEDFYEVSSIHNFYSAGRRGFRYIKIEATNGDIQISNLVCNEENYPVQSRGSFFCSDKELNEIWSICERTTRLCMQNWYEDGVKRDGLLWIGDARVQMLCNYALYGDIELAKECLKMISNSQREDGMTPACAVRGGAVAHPGRIEYMFGAPVNQLKYMTEDQGSLCLLNYCIDFIGMVYEYFMFSADFNMLEQLFPFVSRQAHFLFDTISKNDYNDYLLQPSFTTRRVDNINETASYLSCLLFGLENYLKITQILNQKEEQHSVEKKILELKQRLKDEFIDEEGLLRQEDDNAYSSTAHAFAFMSGFLGKKDVKKLFTQCKYNVLNSVIGMCEYWQMRGMMSAGLIEKTLIDIRKIYGLMLENGATTCFEALDIEEPQLRLQHYRGSRCHGWSAGPVDLFARYILGVEFLEPGGRRVRIAPNLSKLLWVEGTVPTAYGDIYIRVDQEGTYIKAPQDVIVERE